MLGPRTPWHRVLSRLQHRLRLASKESQVARPRGPGSNAGMAQNRGYLSDTTMPDSRKRCPMKNRTTGGNAAPIETAMIRCQGLEP